MHNTQIWYSVGHESHSVGHIQMIWRTSVVNLKLYEPSGKSSARFTWFSSSI